MIDLNFKNHKLSSIKNSKYIFNCEKCNNLIKFDSPFMQISGYNWVYYLDYEKGGFWPLRDCHDMLIKDIIE